MKHEGGAMHGHGRYRRKRKERVYELFEALPLVGGPILNKYTGSIKKPEAIEAASGDKFS